MFERPFFDIEDPDMTIELSDADSGDTSPNSEGGSDSGE
jgi:hypothetical protein